MDGNATSDVEPSAEEAQNRSENSLPPGVDKVNQKKEPRPKYNFISWLLFLWLEPLLWRGFRKGVTQEDVFPHPSEVDAQKLFDQFSKYWEKELKRKKNGKKPRLLLTLIRCMTGKFLLTGVGIFVETALQVSQSVMLGFFADSIVDDSPNSTRNAYLYGLGLTLSAILNIFVHGHTFLLSFRLGMIARVVMTSVIYQKVTKLSQVTIGKLSIGHIVNLASNDVQRFELAFLYPHILWIAPIHLGVVTYLAYIEVGWSAFIITGFTIFQVPLQILLAKVFAKIRHKSALVTDKRIRIMNEIITGIKVIKMYAWEYALKAIVSRLRRKESRLILKGGIVRAIALAFMIVSLAVISFLLFSVFTATGGVLTPKRVFTVLSLLISLRLTSIHYMVQNVLAISESLVAISRIGKLLAIEESVQDKTSEQISGVSELEASLSVQGLSASWFDTPVLENISFEVNKTKPVLSVVGPVGAGKSTLLQCLLSELQPTSGSVKVSGRLSYTAQEPWLFSGSLRDNILFGSDYDPVRYNKVITACALKKDIERLVDGDQTLVGERGITLSGGQKARVSLARAVYHKADIYLLDDPLSAVDAAVAKHLYEKCIRGFLSDSLVILVTHQVQFALQSDQVLGIKEGKVEIYGNVNELLQRNTNLKQLFGLLENEEESKQIEPEVHNIPNGRDHHTNTRISAHLPISKRASLPLPHPGIGQLENTNDAFPLRHRTQSLMHRKNSRRNSRRKLVVDSIYSASDFEPSMFSIPSLQSLHSEVSVREEDIREEVAPAAQPPPEEKSQGSITMGTYVKYFLAGGNILVLLIMIITFIFAEGSLVVSDWWISDWSQCTVLNGTEELNRSTCLLSTNERIAIFGGTLAGTIILNFAKTVLFFAICINASRVLHNRMFRRILRAPMLFFDNNPIGRILNRFSKDVGFLDDLLPYVFCEFILFTSRVLAVLITAVVALPWLLIPCVFLLVLLILIRWYYLVTARDLKRLEGLARSPVYSHISTTLQGLSTIRSFKKSHVSINQFYHFQNEHSRTYYTYLVVARWLGIRLDSLSTILLALVAFIAVPLSTVFDPALIGLALTYIVSLSGMFQYTVRVSTDIESIMVSAERVNEYNKLENEASLETFPIANKPDKDWPSKGCVELENVTFRYAPNLPLVLRGINFSTKPAEKIGVVGRTGAGKSSLLSVLFRLAEPSGAITIDGVNILSIGLHDVRSKISIIPQDPVLFSGTMRYNLDPFSQFSDSDLWDALEQVQLKLVVEQLEGQLTGEVSEGGSNFSVGQKQLVCLARALLRKNRILILDEATANVDVGTDEVIQQAIREKFVNCTVITIAHRLNTIMDSDRILVLDSGEVKEFDTPFNLLQNHHSLLAEMVRKTGRETARKLQQIATTKHNDIRRD